MARPSVNFNIRSNALGNVPVSPAQLIAVLGCSSAGTDLSVSSVYRVPDRIVTDYGYGPGPELAGAVCRSGIGVVFVKVPTNTPGVAGAVSHTGTGTSIVTISGTPYDDYEIQIIPTRAGTAGSEPAPGFQISFDGGRTFSREIRVPTDRTYEGLQAETGLVFNFSVGTLVVDDLYEATTVGPLWSASDVADALEALRISKRFAGIVYVTGAADESDVSAQVGTIDNFVDLKKFTRVIFESRDIADGETEVQWMDALIADFADFTNDRVGVAAGYARVTSAYTGWRYRRSIGWLACVRAGLVTTRTVGPTFGQDLGAVEDGPLVSYSQNGRGTPVTEVYHDEGLVPGLDAERFITITSFPGSDDDGYFICNPNLMCGPTSDFTLLQYGRVMDEGCRVTNTFFTGRLSSAVRLDPVTGFILEKDARALESGNDTGIAQALVASGNASARANDQYTVLSRVDNISTTKTITVTVKILPLGYIKEVDVTMTFENPAFATAA